MSAEDGNPVYAEGDAETAPLLGPKDGAVVSVLVQARSNGTFSSSSVSVATSERSETDAENGLTNGTEDVPKLKVNMKALGPALAIGVSGCFLKAHWHSNFSASL